MKLLLGAAAVALAGCAAETAQVEVRPLADPAAKLGSGSERLAEARGQLVLGNVGLAIEGFHAALREQPTSIEAMGGLAACYDSMGRTDLSRQYYEAALAVAPHNAALLNAFAGSLEAQGKRIEAMGLRSEAAQASRPAPAAPQPPVLAVAAKAVPPSLVNLLTAPRLVASAPPAETVIAPAPPADPAIASAPAADTAIAPAAKPQEVAAAVPVPVQTPVAAPAAVQTLVAAPAAVQTLAAAPAPAREVVASATPAPAPVVVASASPPQKQIASVPATKPTEPSFVAAAPPAQTVTIALPPPRPAAAEIEVAAPVPQEPAPTAPQEPTVPPAPQLATLAALEPAGPRLQRLSPGEVALLTSGGPAWQSKVVAHTARSTTVRWVALNDAANRPNIRLLNAARSQGLAARTRAYLMARGWRNIVIGDADKVRQSSLVMYPSGRQTTGRSLAAQFGFRPGAVQQGQVIVVYLGRDAAPGRAARARA